jgi:hypothetical protein
MTNKVLGIDPGPTESAFVIWDGERIWDKRKVGNYALLAGLTVNGTFRVPPSCCIIEKVASYGMAVGESVFETVFWSGRFAQAWGSKGFFDRITRKDVKMHLCGSMRAKDSNIRAALIDRFGEPGKKAKPGITHGLSKDTWSAFAVCVVWLDQEIATEHS